MLDFAVSLCYFSLLKFTQMISENVKYVTERIARSCEKARRRPEDVRLICVTKTASVVEIEEVLSSGVRLLGENRVRDAIARRASIGDRAEWHMVGHLQANKAKDAVKIFSLIHSVDSVRLAKEIDKEAEKIGKVQDILIQVNTSGEASKSGIEPGAAEDFIREAAEYRNISIKGLMTIAPEVDDPEKVRPYFRALRELRDKIASSAPVAPPRNDGGWILSMGMTNDFEAAIEEGSNMVRIGRAVFG
ncbi:MAG: YggS family pyridoxal phosphate-dependent enzyme [Candidatus Omnitrophota bacterium]|nr:YggS family pyridoxal phosphate-dependent enzyme [Candidatus Omnitrophota bacterium]